MNIIIAGVGKIGRTLAKQLTAEGHNLTLIDAKPQVLETTVEAFDAMGVCGNCASMEVLKSAGIEETDLVIAVTNADEVNLLCCLTAHGLNPNVHTIARIRDPEYAEQIMAMRDVFPLSMTVNPEKRAAREIERLLKFPGFLRRESFAKGRVEIVELRVEKNSPLNNVSLMDMRNVVKCKVLVCAVLRDGEAVAPSGNFVLREGDRIFVTAATSELALLLKNLGIITHRVRKVLLCGGGKVSFYLAKLLEKGNMDVRLLEKNYERCVELAEDLPGTSVIHGDCSNMNVLEAQGFDQCDALVSLTGLDETNMIVALYGENRGVRQIITKISREENGSIANELALGSVINPRELCSNHIVRYVRAMENQVGAAVSVHAIADGKAEAVEFLVDDATKNCGIALKEINLKKNVLLAVINRGTKTLIPNGNSYFQKGDSVVVVTSGRGILRNINDIFA